MLNSFRNKNFLIYFAGQSFSLPGSWVQQVALIWLVYDITGSAFLVGLTGFVSQIPVFIIAPFAGVISDKYSKKNILIITQVLAMLQAFILAWYTWSNQTEIYQILIMAALLGIITGFEIPARQSLMSDLVNNKKDLSNAIALNSLLVNSARFIGPVIAGTLISLYDTTVCFIINGFSYSAIIFSLIFINTCQNKIKSCSKNKPSHSNSFKEGLIYIQNTPVIKNILLFLALSSFTITPYIVLMPLVVEEIFNNSASAMGFLLAPAGLGAIAGNIYLTSFYKPSDLCRTVIAGSFIASVSLTIFAVSSIYWVSLILMAFVGFGFILQVVSSNMIIQDLVEDSKRGRIMSLYTMAYVGMIPFGSITAGAIAHVISATQTLLILGLCCIFGALIYGYKIKCQKNRLHSELASQY